MSAARAEEADLDKGGAAEEALRLYFQSLGAFVVRGAKVRAGRDLVTDIDLWVYTRASVHARHIAIVDIKNKRRARGYERLIWLKGLLSAVGADEGIIATTGSKEDLRPFANRLKIQLLSAQTFKAVTTRFAENNTRLTSEDLELMWRRTKIEGAKDLASLMDTCLVELGLGLSFSAMNIWIDEAAKLLAYCHDHERDAGGPAARAVLMLASLVAICADYMGRNMAFADVDTRRAFFREGLVFGRPEEGTAARYISFAERVATDFVDKSGAAAASIRLGFQHAVDNLPVAPFIDLFARPSAGRDLLDAAVQLEAAAFATGSTLFGTLPTGAKTILGLLIDYAGLSRRRFAMGSVPLTTSGGGSLAEPQETAAASTSDDAPAESEEGQKRSESPSRATTHKQAGRLL